MSPTTKSSTPIAPTTLSPTETLLWCNSALQVDSEGLPLVYDKDLIQAYWKQEGNALQQRWTEFLGYSVPYLTRAAGMLITGIGLGNIAFECR